MPHVQLPTTPPSRWILTGGSGFLGTNFLQQSRAEDGEIVVISRHPSRWPVIRPWIRYIEQDIREIESIRQELVPGSVVVHIASGSYPGKAEKMIESDIQDNVLGTIRLAQACADQGVRSFVFLSSGGSVYGDQTISPIREDASPLPISAYGAMKLTIEHYLYIIHHLKGLPVVSLRVGNCFGRWHTGSGQGAVNVFLKKVLDGQSIEIWGDGEQVRDYVSAEDVCYAIRTVGLQHVKGYDTFNVGTGTGYSLKDILARIERVTGITPQITYLPPRNVDVQSNVLDTTKIRERFGWEPSRPFEAALADTWEWVKAQ
ncbi:MAG: NAD-dependent epimerase/dehydratase family protein [Patescibacteria group bacterium]